MHCEWSIFAILTHSRLAFIITGLFIPVGMGLQELVLHEFYYSPLAGYFDTGKVISALNLQVW